MFGSDTTTLLIFNEEMNDIMKNVKSLEQSGLLIKGVSETIKIEAKEQKGRFLTILLGTLGAILLGNLLTGNRVKSVKKPGQGVWNAGEDTIRAGQDF